MSLWLSDDEVADLTGKRQRRKQCDELARLGVKFRVRGDGFPLVERWQFEGQPVAKRRREPNWDAVRN